MSYDAHLTYLLLNIGTVLFPIILSFDKKVAFYKKWINYLFAMIIIGIPMIFWDSYFTKLSYWGFNPSYIIGGKIFQLPYEEIGFFVTVPYSCLFIYECVKQYSGKAIFSKSSKINFIVVSVILLIIACFNFKIWYTFNTFIICGVLLIIESFFGKKSGWLMVSILICFIPMLLVNGILTFLPVVWYNNDFNLSLRIGSIPIEDFFYNSLMVIGWVWVYEYIDKIKSKTV